MTTKYDPILLTKFIEPSLFNLPSKYSKTHPILKLLTYDHFAHLFQRNNNKETDYYSIIKQELLNKTFIPKQPPTQIPEHIQSLAQELKSYYKSKHFTLNHFLYYLYDIAETAYKLSKFPNTQPKSSDEALNEIERRVLIVKSLDYYQRKSFMDRIQMNLIALSKTDPEVFKSEYEVKVIDKQSYDKLKYAELIKTLGALGSKRRLLGFEYGNYNYIPIICKKYCSKQSEIMINAVKAFCDHCSCDICKEVLSKQNEINDEIKVLYFKSCCFSHNATEYDYHPFIYHTYRCECKDRISSSSSCPQQHDDNIEFLFNQSTIKDIRVQLSKLLDNIAKDLLLCYRPDIKTNKCSVLQGSQYHNVYICKDFHSSFEKRRNKTIINNTICPMSIKDSKWGEYNSCSNKAECTYHHTKNELFYDERNYRKIYDCYKVDYCDNGDMCPYKHPYDINVDEIYLPSQEKMVIQAELDEIKEMERNITYLKSLLKKFECCLCLRYDQDVIYMNKKCKHFLCLNCHKSMTICPVCPLNINKEKDEAEDDQEMTYIKFDLKGNDEQKINKDYSFNNDNDNEENCDSNVNDDDKSIDHIPI